MTNNRTERRTRLLAVLLTLALLLGDVSPAFAAGAQSTVGPKVLTRSTTETTGEKTGETLPVATKSAAAETTVPTTSATTPAPTEEKKKPDLELTTSNQVAGSNQPGENDTQAAPADTVITTDGIDLYTHNGKTVTLTGEGGYTVGQNSHSVGKTTYELKASQTLTASTAVNIAAGVSAHIVMHNVEAAGLLTLHLGSGASAVVTISGNGGMASVTLDGGASLNLSGGQLTLGSISGGAAVTLGSASVNLSGSITSGSITLSSMTVNGGSIAASQNLSISSSTLNGMGTVSSVGDLQASGSTITATQFGIRGSGTVSLTGSGTVTANRIGALEDNSIAYLDSKEMTVSGSEYWDYKITYQNYGEEGYAPWTSGEAPHVYRVFVNGANRNLAGYHTGSGYVTADQIPLTVQPSRENYAFRLWSAVPMGEDADEATDKTNEEWLTYDGLSWDEKAQTTVQGGTPAYTGAQITANSGNVTVYAVYVPQYVTVQLHSNLTQDSVYAKFPAYVGAQGVSLQGYLDAKKYPVLDQLGKKVITFADKAEKGNTVNVAQYQVAAGEADGTVDLYAVWSSGIIETSFMVTTYYPNHTYEYQDEAENWQPLTGDSLDAVNKSLEQNLQSVQVSFGEPYGELPELRLVQKEGATESYNFLGWYVARQEGQVAVDQDTVVDETTTTENALTTGSQVLFANFENARYTLTVTDTDKWTFYKENGEELSFTGNGDGTKTANVNSDTQIIMKRSSESTVAAYWRLWGKKTVTDGKPSAYIWPQERSAEFGGEYWLYYSFIMPQDHVVAEYSETVRWDTAAGDYAFGTYTINGWESYGIQITDPVGEVTYHRWIMSGSSTTAYFTSSKETSHRIFLDAATNLYLDGVQLGEHPSLVGALRSFYEADTNGVYSPDVKVYDFAQYQNIVADNMPDNEQPYNATTSYAVNIHVLQDSKVFAIGQRAWLNNVCNNWAKAHRTTYTITGTGKDGAQLQLYSLLSHGTATIDSCNVKVLGDASEQTIHWFHTDAGGSTIKNCKVDAAGRRLFSRQGGSLSGSGNGVSFNLTNSAVSNGGVFHIPCLSASGSTITAEEIRTHFYHYKFKNCTVDVQRLGFEVGVHISYANDFSLLENSTVTVHDWMSSARLKIYNGSRLNITNGLHLYESLYIYGNGTEVNAASFGRFRTFGGGTSYDNVQYSGDNSHHYYNAQIYDGAKVTLTGDFVNGVNHSSMPKIEIFGAGTEVAVGGNADLINNFSVTQGATFKVNGDLTLHQDLNAADAGTVLEVGGNLYHVTNASDKDSLYKTVVREDGSAEQVYWTFNLDNQASVSIGGILGSKSEDDRTNVVYDRNATNLTCSTVNRDVQVFYTMPGGYANSLDNPVNIRLEKDGYHGAAVTLKDPEPQETPDIELEENCWYAGEENITGWTENQTFEAYDGFLRLSAKPTGYALTLFHDGGAITSIRYKSDLGEWVPLTNIPASGGTVKIPADAQVEVTIRGDYASLVCAESILNGFFSPVALTKASSETACTVSFTMDQMQVQLRAQQQMELYLDEGNVYILEQNGEVGFARYNGTGFVPYGGNILVTQKNPSAYCYNTLYLNRNVAADSAKVTLTGINLPTSGNAVRMDTVSYAPGVNATLHLTGNNLLRNIRVPASARATIIGDSTADSTFVQSAHFSGNYNAEDPVLYYALVGDQAAGPIRLIGGTYRSSAGYNNQGSAAAFGSKSGGNSIYLEEVSIYYTNEGTGTPTLFNAGSSDITVKNSVIELLTNGGTMFSCKNLTMERGSASYTYKETASARSIFIGVSGSVSLKDTQVTDKVKNSSQQVLADCNGQSLMLSGSASYTVGGGLIQKSITVADTASIKAENGVIAANTIDVSGGSITCGFLLSSGYVTGQTDGSGLIGNYVGNSKIQTGGSITVSGGSVTATGSKVRVVTATNSTGVESTLPGVVGGSRGCTVNLTGGSVQADRIGDNNYVFGMYRSQNYAIADQQAVGALVNITGGMQTFQVLGGSLAQVDISGNADVEVPAGAQIEGSIIQIRGNAHLTLPDTATIGSDSSEITISGSSRITGDSAGYGSIVAMGGSLTIQDQSSVHVGRINLEKGSVTVTTTNKTLESTYPYTRNQSVKDMVGLFVDYGGTDIPDQSDPMGSHKGDLAAGRVFISGESSVSAYRIGSNAAMPDSGSMTTQSGSFFACQTYGAYGSGMITVEKENGAQWSGDRLTSVNYDFGEGVRADEVIMPEDALYYYSAASGKIVKLPVPERKGYRFEGWVYQGSEDIITEIELLEADRYLTAKWTPVNIWIHLKDAESWSQWMEIPYGQPQVIYESHLYKGMATVGYTAEGIWQDAFGSKMLLAGTPLAVPKELYDAYLQANNVDYADGLNEAEKQTLRILENLTEADLDGQTAVQFPQMNASWNAVQITVTFDAVDTQVEVFRYGDELHQITQRGTGKEQISYLAEHTYASGYLPTSTGTVEISGIPVPVRKGYNFEKWVSGEYTLTAQDTDRVVDSSITHWKAQYNAKSFRVYLLPEIDGKLGTLSSEAGLEKDETSDYFYITARFDQNLYNGTLPQAQIQGYVHRGWKLLLKDEPEGWRVSEGTVFQWDTQEAANPNGKTFGSENADGIFVLVPDLRPTKITYDLRGGSWNDPQALTQFEKLVYEKLPTVEYELKDDVYKITGEDSLKRHGYRFLGWTDKTGYDAWKASGMAEAQYFAENAGALLTNANVLYSDVTYYAIWKPSEYKVKLHSWSTAEEIATWKDVQVGGSIEVSYAGETEANADQDGMVTLPETSKGTMKHTSPSFVSTRQLLGWMFSPINPVTSYYTADGKIKPDYADEVTRQMNAGAVYQNGETFQLPQFVNDPGDGGELDMYAIYRERSLIFVQRYPDGQQTVLKIADYNVERSGYMQAPTAVVPTGYSLAGWYVNSTTPEPARDYSWYGLEFPAHPQRDQYVNVEGPYVFHQGATTGTYLIEEYMDQSDSGNFDIYVYTYFAPTLNAYMTLYAQAGNNPAQPTDTYVIPDTLKVPYNTYFSYQVDTISEQDENIRFVKKSVIDAWDGGDTWTVDGETYDANRTFALELIAATDQATVTIPLVEGLEPVKQGYITAGSVLKINVYSTNRLAENKQVGKAVVTFTFPGLTGAKVTVEAALHRRAARYELDLAANTPADEKFADISGWADGDTIRTAGSSYYRNFLFGDDAGTLPKLMLTGYTHTGWKDESGADVTGALKYAPGKGSTSDKAQTLSAVWEKNLNKLTLDSGMIENWDLSFWNGSENVPIDPVAGVYTVPYKTTVKLVPKAGREVDGYPEFINGTELTTAGTTVQFAMPDEDVALTYSRVVKLDVSGGSVNVDANGYNQSGGSYVTWRGDYVFTGTGAEMITLNTGNKPTPNVSHKITFGDLTGAAVQVNNNVQLDIAGNTTLKHISAAADLTLAGAGGKLTLKPETGAAISGTQVTLSDLSCEMQLSNSSHSQSGNVNTSAVSATSLQVSGGTLDVTFASQVATYAGVVFQSNVQITGFANVTVKAGQGSDVGEEAALIGSSSSLDAYGATVESSLGFATTGTLRVHSVLNENNEYIAARVTILGDKFPVTAGTIVAEDNSGIYAYNARISGDQTIAVNANVVDQNGRHLDLKSGSVKITASGYRQDTRSVSEKYAYVLVGWNEQSTVSATEPLGYLHMDGAKAGNMTLEGNVTINLLSDSSVGSISGSNPGTIVTIQGSQKDSKAKLVSAGDIVAHGLTLVNCVVDASGHEVGSQGTITESGKVGHLKLNNADVTAEKVGALGAFEESFTGVTLQESTVTGNLVIDHFRLDYQIGKHPYDTKELPEVLRTTQENHDGQQTAEELDTGYLAKPKRNDGGQEDYFVAWYVLGKNEERILVGESVPEEHEDAFAEEPIRLDADCSKYVEPPAKDGSVALKVYAYFQAFGTATIQAGRVYDMALNDGGDSVAIAGDKAWTARFDVTDSTTDEHTYTVQFTNSIPAGTRLILTVLGDSPGYYGYVTGGETAELPLAAFGRMGSSEPPVFTGGLYSFLLAADYTDCGSAQSETVITMKSGNSPVTGIDPKFTRTAPKVWSTTVNGQNVSLQGTENNLALIAKLEGPGIPLNAAVSLQAGETEISGQWFAGNCTVFKLGASVADSYSWKSTGLKTGTYTVSFRLAELAENGVNVLRTSGTAEFTFTVKEEQKRMAVTMDTQSFAWEKGTAKTVAYTVAGIQPTSIIVVKQNAVGTYGSTSVGEITIANGTITFPATLAAGSYRVCFSFDDSMELDNVYYTFVVKDTQSES